MKKGKITVSGGTSFRLLYTLVSGAASCFLPPLVCRRNCSPERIRDLLRVTQEGLNPVYLTLKLMLFFFFFFFQTHALDILSAKAGFQQMNKQTNQKAKSSLVNLFAPAVYLSGLLPTLLFWPHFAIKQMTLPGERVP